MQKKFHVNNEFFSTPVRIKDHYVYQAGIMYFGETEKFTARKNVFEFTSYTDNDGKVYLNGVATHVQPELFEFTSVLGGKGKIYANGTPTAVKRGDVFVSFPGDTHRIESDKDDKLSYAFLAFNTTDPELKASLEEVMVKFTNPEHRVINNDLLTSALNETVSEINSMGKLSVTYLDGLLKQIVILSVRSFGKWNPLSLAPSSDQQLCYFVINYIDTHVFTMKHIKELSKATNYNYSYLSALFKKTTGQNIADYYKKKRMEKAKYLVEDKMKLTKIAELLSYSNVYAFSKAYKAYFGHSPIEDRKKQ